LRAAVGELTKVEQGDMDSLAIAGGHLEAAVQYLRWRVEAPESPVLERIIGVARGSAGSARPLADAISQIGDDLPSGPLNLEAETRRAVEVAFAAGLRWLPLA